MNPTMHTYDSKPVLAQALAGRIAAQLSEAIASRGSALLALSGGSTPKLLMETLSGTEIDWSRVTVTLVDERWVDDSDERSNARLLKTHLLKNKAAAAHFVPLYAAAPTPESALATINARIDGLALPLDVAVLGMGGDGHTASFFPGGDRLDEALDPNGTHSVLPMRAEGAGEPRVTLTVPRLIEARALYLHIEGDGKREVYEQALNGTDYPITRVIKLAAELETYWAP
ncbi:6-phosphogluconolactonase [Oleiagrimonas sp. C23AA]|uniref:6-phosphogluconolactonase n=1 Tax=Oleiagrimonas sp. C23AA TaxID=2719047 RepID=UPI0014220B7C|nr:6-phosphogluconolactonase [Oleiagrimonas sp. C23AA]NII12145.1 6-phosphogluconolactonase [Oleiagrimonas sp. C23AA]